MASADAVYRDIRERLSDFVLGLDVGATRAAVPACPGWSVQDVVSHVVGIVADLQEGRLDDVGSDAWTLAQVTTRRDLSMAAVIAEWSERAPAFEEQVAAWPAHVAAQVVSDAAMHEFDIRATVGDRGARDTVGVDIALGYYGHKIADQIDEAGLGALTLETEAGATTLGAGAVGAALRTSRFEALRALGGRRSIEQIRALDWEGDADPYVALMDRVGGLVDPLVE